MDQGSTSDRATKGAIGLLGLWTPAPEPAAIPVLPLPSGELSWVCAPTCCDPRTKASAKVAIPESDNTKRTFVIAFPELMLVFHAAKLANGQTFASGLQFFLTDFFFLSRF